MANKDFKLLAEAYDQVVKNNFDIGTENTPPGGVKTETKKQLTGLKAKTISLTYVAETEEQLNEIVEAIESAVLNIDTPATLIGDLVNSETRDANSYERASYYELRGL